MSAQRQWEGGWEVVAVTTTTSWPRWRPGPGREDGAGPPRGNQDGIVQGATDMAPVRSPNPPLEGWNEPQPGIMMIIGHCDEALGFRVAGRSFAPMCVRCSFPRSRAVRHGAAVHVWLTYRDPP